MRPSLNRTNFAIAACMLASAVCMAFTLSPTRAQAQDSSDAEAYGRAVSTLCKPAETMERCNVRITLVAATVEKMHELAPTGILLGAYLAEDSAGAPVVCGYGWENDIGGDHARIAFTYKLRNDTVGGPPAEVTLAESNASGCYKPKIILYKH